MTPIVKQGDAVPDVEPPRTFTSFGSDDAVAVSGGTVVFTGVYSGGEGIFTSSAGALHAVIKTGDPLFSSVVTSLQSTILPVQPPYNLTPLGLDPGGSGSIAFTYTLADGRKGVAIASLPPPLTISCPPAQSVQCLGDMPAAATDTASFVSRGGSVSGGCAPITVRMIREIPR